MDHASYMQMCDTHATHPDSLKGMVGFAEAQNVLERRKTGLAKTTSKANLEAMYSNQDWIAESRTLPKKSMVVEKTARDMEVLEKSKTARGESHPSALTSMVNPASTYTIGINRPSGHALIIGIDTYMRSPLKGAVNDARLVHDFWNRKFRGRVYSLHNHLATRSNVINSFEMLIDDNMIGPNDPILIYFAGHGTMCERPRGADPNFWTDKEVQAIVPFDGLPPIPSAQSGVGGAISNVRVYPQNHEPIPDRTIGALLSLLANKHGDNIVSLFLLVQKSLKEGVIDVILDRHS